LTIAHALTSAGHDASEDGTGRGTPLVIAQNGSDIQTGDYPGTLAASHARQTSGDLVAFIVNGVNSNAIQDHARETDIARTLDGWGGGFADNQGGTVVAASVSWRGRGMEEAGDIATAIRSGGQGHTGDQMGYVRTGMMIRRLTPVECLRLMGAPDDYLDLNPPLSDGAKYRLCGNGVVVPVAEWVGRRLAAVHGRDT
jgi:DNA (cytosine-5)-methyltransferase 1